MNRQIRRGIVVLGVVASLVLGAFSIRVAADLAAAAAPPPAPPVSLDTLKRQLEAEQTRATGLQTQLQDLLDVTQQLTAALDETGTQVDTDGLTAAELRGRLKAAEARLGDVNRLLKKAQARLAALGQSVEGDSSGTKPSTGGSGGGGGASTTPAATPTVAPTAPAAASPFTLSVSVVGSGIKATWSTCSPNNFQGYALVRSTDNEIHYPPEDRDTLVGLFTSAATTTTTDTAAPSGSLWYRLYCLTRSDGETRVASSTATVKIINP